MVSTLKKLTRVADLFVICSIHAGLIKGVLKSEHLRFKVETWSADGGKRHDTLTMCTTVEYAEAVLDAAARKASAELITISQGARLIRRTGGSTSVLLSEPPEPR